MRGSGKGEDDVIELSGVTKRFGDKTILNHVDLRLGALGMTALIGPSGAGKTTVGRMLLGLDADFDGEIRGVPAARACVFQEDRLLPQLNASQNVRFVNPSLSEERLKAAFDAVGLTGEMNANVMALSGGMRRRVSILRALLSDAAFIVMDEAMKGLDESVARATARYIEASMGGRTLLYITHSMEEIAWLGIPTVLRIDNGGICHVQDECL